MKKIEISLSSKRIEEKPLMAVDNIKRHADGSRSASVKIYRHKLAGSYDVIVNAEGIMDKVVDHTNGKALSFKPEDWQKIADLIMGKRKAPSHVSGRVTKIWNPKTGRYE